jgi:hypothetical protein
MSDNMAAGKNITPLPILGQILAAHHDDDSAIPHNTQFTFPIFLLVKNLMTCENAQSLQDFVPAICLEF